MDMALETEVRHFCLSSPHAALPLRRRRPPLARSPPGRRPSAAARRRAAAGRRLIKRVEILSDVQKELNVEAQDVAALSRTQTVGEVVEAMIKELGGAGAGGGRRRCRRAVVGLGRVAGEATEVVPPLSPPRRGTSRT